MNFFDMQNRMLVTFLSLMRLGFFVLSLMRPYYNVWIPDITLNDDRNSKRETQEHCFCALSQLMVYAYNIDMVVLTTFLNNMLILHTRLGGILLFMFDVYFYNIYCLSQLRLCYYDFVESRRNMLSYWRVNKKNSLFLSFSSLGITCYLLEIFQFIKNVSIDAYSNPHIEIRTCLRICLKKHKYKSKWTVS